MKKLEAWPLYVPQDVLGQKVAKTPTLVGKPTHLAFLRTWFVSTKREFVTAVIVLPFSQVLYISPC